MPVQSVTLVRHGRVKALSRARIPASGFRAFVECFRTASVDPQFVPPRRLCHLAEKADVLTSSDLPRAIESAQLLAPGRKAMTDALFREVGVPVTLRAPFRLRPTTWAFWARALWFAGWKEDCESFTEARLRSRLAAARLGELASVHGTVVVMAHGIINTLVARELKRAGWRGPVMAAWRHWGATEYVRVA